MISHEVSKFLDKEVIVNNSKINGKFLFTAYIFRIKDGKKVYQAEVQNVNSPHEIYIVALDDLKGE